MQTVKGMMKFASFTDEHGTKYTPFIDDNRNVGYEVESKECKSYVTLIPSDEDTDGVSYVTLYHDQERHSLTNPITYIDTNRSTE